MGFVTLVLGGVRSGKSAWAERQVSARAANLCLPKIYVATCEPFDDELRARVARHQQDRAAQGWQSLEIPCELPAAIATPDYAHSVMLVDCLTMWMGNVMHHEYDGARYSARLLDAIKAAPQDITLVSNEVGLGIIPESPLARRFCDDVGRLHQSLAALADRVVWMLAGIPTFVKGSPE